MSDRRSFMKTAGAAAAGIALAEALGASLARAEGRSHRTDDFIRSVQRARIFDLSHVWDENSPIASVNPGYEMKLDATHAATRGTFDPDGQLSFTSEIQKWSGQHGAPSIDAIGHIGHNGKLFGGVDAAASTSDLQSTYLGTAIMDALKQICARWPVGSIDPGFKTPVVSDTPVLLLSGEYDPITPPAYAEQVKATGLANSVHLVGQGQGHGLVGIGCTPRLLRSFLATPEPGELDASCLALETPTPLFLTRQGPAP